MLKRLSRGVSSDSRQDTDFVSAALMVDVSRYGLFHGVSSDSDKVQIWLVMTSWSVFPGMVYFMGCPLILDRIQILLVLHSWLMSPGIVNFTSNSGKDTDVLRCTDLVSDDVMVDVSRYRFFPKVFSVCELHTELDRATLVVYITYGLFHRVSSDSKQD